MVGNLNAKLVIPIDTARIHGLENPTEVVVRETENGILVTRNEIDR